MVTAIYVLATKVSLIDSNGKRLLTYKWTSIALSIFSMMAVSAQLEITRLHNTHHTAKP